jgi:trehalose synthase-fused probable maltokinase
MEDTMGQVEHGASPDESSSSVPSLRTDSLEGPDLLARHASFLATAVAARIVTCRWFGAKTRTIERVSIVDSVALAQRACLVIVRIDFKDAPSEYYQLPLAIVRGPAAQHLLREGTALSWAQLQHEHDLAVIIDGTHDADFCAALMQTIAKGAVLPGTAGQIVAWRGDAFDRLHSEMDQRNSRLIGAEQSNSSIVFGDRLVLKLFRRLDEGVNPDLEVNRVLAQRRFTHVPPLAGSLEYRQSGRGPRSLAMLQGFVRNQGDAWQHTLTCLHDLFLRAGSGASEAWIAQPLPGDGISRAAVRALPPTVSGELASFIAEAQLLAERTAEMHLALASATDEQNFRPEPFTPDDQRTFRDRASAAVAATFGDLHARLPHLPPSVRPLAARVASMFVAAESRYQRMASEHFDVQKIRCHGDYHLGQVLYIDGDFAIIDFEGEPARPLAERREKQLALRDVAGMVRSYHYASCVAAARAKREITTVEPVRLDALANAWYFWMSVAFVGAYLRRVTSEPSPVGFLPADAEQLRSLFEMCLLEKAVYELRYELNHRPDWVYLPLTALEALLRSTP